ncbi:hypothetical protein ACQPX6_21390 [Actinomycetospora sp. CA-101289]|uniref:hypothetical protein n=1 Tax=Actinomycetospora sp. CA-101289 TaxID=3239893 RepID=UPI003D9962B6
MSVARGRALYQQQHQRQQQDEDSVRHLDDGQLEYRADHDRDLNTRRAARQELERRHDPTGRQAEADATEQRYRVLRDHIAAGHTTAHGERG